MDDLIVWVDGVANSNVSPEQKLALDMWLQYNTLACIKDAVNKPLATVRDWIYTGRNGMKPFNDIRDCMQKEQLAEIVKHKMPLMKSIMDSSLHIIADNVNNLKKSKAELTIDEVKKISDIASNMDKILKLDEGVATENIAIARVNPISKASEIKDLLASVDDFGLFDITDEED